MNETCVELINEQEILGKNFRIFGDFNNPLFLAKDVAEWIDYAKTSQGYFDVSTMLRSVDDDEKVKIFTTTNNPRSGCEKWFLTENGLYEVLMLSRKPIAKEFKKEVKKVLHSLRVNGGYIANQENLSPEQIVANALVVAQKIIADKDKLIEEQKPKVETYDHIMNSEGLKTMKEVGDVLKLGQKTIFGVLRAMGIITKCNGSNVPKKTYIDRGYFEVKFKEFEKGGKTYMYTQTFVTPKGAIWLEKKVTEWINEDELMEE